MAKQIDDRDKEKGLPIEDATEDGGRRGEDSLVLPIAEVTSESYGAKGGNERG